MRPSLRRLDCPRYDKLIEIKTAKSLVWNCFGLPAKKNGRVLDKNVAICKLCGYPVSRKGGSTSNLKAHLKLYHPSEYAKMYISSQPAQSLEIVGRD